MIFWIFEPRLSPNIDRVSIPNSPLQAFFHHYPWSMDTMPNITWIVPNRVSIKFPFGKYLVFKTFETIVSWLVKNFQPYFPSMVKLKAWRYLNSIPPSSFFIVIFFQFNQFMAGATPFFESHQKEFIIFSS